MIVNFLFRFRESQTSVTKLVPVSFQSSNIVVIFVVFFLSYFLTLLRLFQLENYHKSNSVKRRQTKHYESIYLYFCKLFSSECDLLPDLDQISPALIASMNMQQNKKNIYWKKITQKTVVQIFSFVSKIFTRCRVMSMVLYRR